MPKPVTYIGLDLGQAQDYTALAVVTRLRHHDYTDPNREPRLPPYDVPFLKRFPLGTPYTTIVPFVIGLLRTRELSGSLLLVDYTGVGQAIDDYFDMALREGRVTYRYCPITLTAGTNVIPAKEGGFLVPKKELVTALQLLLQTRRIRIPRSLPDADLLSKELQNFRTNVTLNDSDPLLAWRDGQHDDLVLATALALWVGEQALHGEQRSPAPSTTSTHEPDYRPWWQR